MKATLVKDGAPRAFDLEPLLSTYLRGAYRHEEPRLVELSADLDRRRLQSVWTVDNALDDFHVSSVLGVVMVGQLTVVYAMLSLGRKEKDREVWVEEIRANYLAPIVDCDRIEVSLECSLPEVVTGPSGQHRTMWNFRADVERRFRLSGRFFVDGDLSQIERL